MRILLLLFIIVVNSHAFQTDTKAVLENFIKSELFGQPAVQDVKCGTRYALEIEHHQNLLDPELYKNFIQAKKSEPARQRSVVSPSGFFELHWDDTGLNAVPQEDLSGNGFPDYIDSAAVILDHVWNIEVGQLAYSPPPGIDGNPAIPYPVYFTNQLQYGVTWPVDLITANLPDTTYTSYIEFDNNYSESYFPTKGLNGLKVTAAHEFHHAIQLGYSFRINDIYFFEMTSTWMEEYLYPDINDYLNYLDDFFKIVSNSRFDYSGSTFPYANSIYLQMLEAEYGAIIVRSIWEKIKIQKSLPALISTLEQINSTWFESLGEYGLWLYYTGDRAIPGNFFNDASFFPQITIKSEDFIEFNGAYVDDLNIKEIANRYLQFQDVRGKIIRIQVNANEHSEAGFRIMTPFSYLQLYQINNVIISDPIDSDQMILVMTNAENNQTLTTIDAGLSGSIDLTSIYSFPNPVLTKETEIVHFQNVPPEAELCIYNTSGKRVASVENNNNSRIRTWYLKNDDGQKVAGGIYIFLVQGDGLLKTGKFSIIR